MRASIKSGVLALVACVAAAASPRPAPGASATWEPDVSAEIRATPTGVCQNESFVLTLVLRSTGVRLAQAFDLAAMPRDRLILETCEELPVERQQTGTRITEMRRFRWRARAPEPGTIHLAPKLHVTVLTETGTSPGPTYREVRRTLSVIPIDIVVRPLPAAVGATPFSGAVGQFSLDVDVSPTNVRPGDLVTLLMAVTGKGYLQDLSPPRVCSGPHFKVYDPEPVPREEPDRRAFRQILIPQSTNALEVPAISFCFFDPREDVYRSVTRGPFPLTFRLSETEGRNLDAGGGVVDTWPANGTSVCAVRAGLLYWAGALLLGLILCRRRRPTAGGGVVLLAAALFVPFHLTVCRLFPNLPLATVARPAKARVAPSTRALPTFDLPEGATVRIRGVQNGWAQVGFGGNRGWTPAAALRTSAPEVEN